MSEHIDPLLVRAFHRLDVWATATVAFLAFILLAGTVAAGEGHMTYALIAAEVLFVICAFVLPWWAIAALD